MNVSYIISFVRQPIPMEGKKSSALCAVFNAPFAWLNWATLPIASPTPNNKVFDN